MRLWLRTNVSGRLMCLVGLHQWYKLHTTPPKRWCCRLLCYREEVIR